MTVSKKKKKFPAISVHKRCCSHQAIMLQRPDGEPWRDSGQKQDVYHAISCGTTPQRHTLGRLKMGRTQDAGPR